MRLFHVTAVSNYPFLKYLWSVDVTLIVALTYELVVSWPTLFISATDLWWNLLVSRLYLMNWLVYIHCYSQIHFVSSLICFLSRASRKFYALISLIHLCKDHCFVSWSGGLLPMPPDLQWSLIWWYQDAWVVNPCVHIAHLRKHLLHPLWPLWPWEHVWHLWCDQKNRSFFCPAPVAVLVPKAANRYPQTGQALDLHTLLFFFSFPDLN